MLRRWWSGSPSKPSKSALSCNNGLQEPRNDCLWVHSWWRLCFQPVRLWIFPESVPSSLNENRPGFLEINLCSERCSWTEVYPAISRDGRAGSVTLTSVKIAVKILLKCLLKSSFWSSFDCSDEFAEGNPCKVVIPSFWMFISRFYSVIWEFWQSCDRLSWSVIFCFWESQIPRQSIKLYFSHWLLAGTGKYSRSNNFSTKNGRKPKAVNAVVEKSFQWSNSR